MQKRMQKLIKPGLQLRLVLIFLCTAGLAVQVQAILLAFTLSQLADDMPTDGNLLLARMPEFIGNNILLTLLFLFPLTIAVGIVATFRFAGPLHRFERFLVDVKDGRQAEPCRLRKGDELGEICALLNEITEPLRARNGSPSDEPRNREVESVHPALPFPRLAAEEARPKRRPSAS